LHKFTPFLTVMQNSGLRVALLTDGRMSGASGQVLAAIHLSPDTLRGGLIGKVQDGDPILIDAVTGCLSLLVDETELMQRPEVGPGSEQSDYGMGRELFQMFRHNVSDSESGATVLGNLGQNFHR